MRSDRSEIEDERAKDHERRKGATYSLVQMSLDGFRWIQSRTIMIIMEVI